MGEEREKSGGGDEGWKGFGEKGNLVEDRYLRCRYVQLEWNG